MDPGKKENSKKPFEPNSGELYVVGTPIGNLGDFSPRAKNLLSKISIIACEDTRNSGKLLKHFKINAPLISFHQHNTKSRIPQLLGFLKDGKSVAIISDAGLPGICDPGEELVHAAQKANFKVICIPGPSAATTALVSSGISSKRFCFEGFLPSKQKDRKLILTEIAKEHRTTIIYESPHKILKLLQELMESCGKDRPLKVARELTKLHEEQIGQTIENVFEHFSKNKPKGEFTLVLGGANASKEEEEERRNEVLLVKKLEKLIENGLSPSIAVKELSIQSGLSKNFLYKLIHKPK